MPEYDFPKDLYIRLENIETLEGRRVKAEIYRRIESEDKELVHMKRVGLIYIGKPEKLNLEQLVERLKDEKFWDAHH